ncbi:MAG: 6-hydroxymethylpterin diphosphokinase MptE-like protein [Rhizomicrobium sp.]
MNERVQRSGPTQMFSWGQPVASGAQVSPDTLPLVVLGRNILRTQSVNPYRIALVEVARRLLWDLNPESWRSRARMKALRNSHRGEKAVILCNGPSLNGVDFSLLEGVYCFGLNKIDLLFSRHAFRPSCIVATNLLVIEQQREFFNRTDIPLFLHSLATVSIKKSPSRIFIPATVTNRKFARDCSLSVYHGATVTFVALQLAYHMGFTSVALVGCDHHYETVGHPNQRVACGASDPNHFDPTYFANQTWQLPDLLESEYDYRMALDAYGRGRRLLVNATDGGKLEVLPRLSLREFLAC